MWRFAEPNSVSPNPPRSSHQFGNNVQGFIWGSDCVRENGRDPETLGELSLPYKSEPESGREGGKVEWRVLRPLNSLQKVWQNRQESWNLCLSGVGTIIVWELGAQGIFCTDPNPRHPPHIGLCRPICQPRVLALSTLTTPGADEETLAGEEVEERWPSMWSLRKAHPPNQETFLLSTVMASQLWCTILLRSPLFSPSIFLKNPSQKECEVG